MQVNKCRFHQIDFDRQKSHWEFHCGFYIKRLGLVIEIDGSSHDIKEEYDKTREDYLLSLGIKIYRIQVNDIMQHLILVMVELEDYIIENYRAE